MKVRRTAMEEAGRGIFRCSIEVSAESLADFLSLIPEAGAVVDVQLERGPGAVPQTPAEARNEMRKAGLVVPEPEPPPTPVNELTQFVAPSGLDISRLGGGRALPREVLVWLVMIRDPIFQEWTVREAKVTHNAIPNIVDFAAEFVAKQAGAPSLFDVAPEHYPGLATLQERFESYMRTRGLASGAAPT